MKSKTGTMLLSLIIAFGLWLYVVTVVSPEQERPYTNVPVTLEGESILRDRNLMIVSDTDLSVRVDLKGNRQDLNNLNSSNLSLTANLSGIYEPGEYHLGYSISFPGNIPAGAVTTMNKEPSTVTVVIAERISAHIPVRVEYIGNAADGFIADKPQAQLDYEEVVITGPKEVVEQIDHAYIRVDCTDATETITESYRFELRNRNGEPVDAAMITTNLEQIQVSVPVFQTKRIELVLNINSGGGATAETSKIEIEPRYIYVSGSESALENLETLIIGTLNLGDILEDTEKTYPIILPEGVTNLNDGEIEATVRISFPALVKKEFVISQISVRNVPEGMTADLITKQLTIVVRGPGSLMNRITEEDIFVEIDVTGVENTAAVEARITFPSEFAGVGAVGKYSVNVQLMDQTDTEE